LLAATSILTGQKHWLQATVAPLPELLALLLKRKESRRITVIGKAFWDVGHAPKDQSNRRKYMPECAVWELHPVMALQVVQ
jgi:hypothetical protein